MDTAVFELVLERRLRWEASAGNATGAMADRRVFWLGALPPSDGRLPVDSRPALEDLALFAAGTSCGGGGAEDARLACDAAFARGMVAAADVRGALATVMAAGTRPFGVAAAALATGVGSCGFADDVLLSACADDDWPRFSAGGGEPLDAALLAAGAAGAAFEAEEARDFAAASAGLEADEAREVDGAFEADEARDFAGAGSDIEADEARDFTAAAGADFEADEARGVDDRRGVGAATAGLPWRAPAFTNSVSESRLKRPGFATRAPSVQPAGGKGKGACAGSGAGSRLRLRLRLRLRSLLLPFPAPGFLVGDVGAGDVIRGDIKSISRGGDGVCNVPQDRL